MKVYLLFTLVQSRCGGVTNIALEFDESKLLSDNAAFVHIRNLLEGRFKKCLKDEFVIEQEALPSDFSVREWPNVTNTLARIEDELT